MEEIADIKVTIIGLSDKCNESLEQACDEPDEGGDDRSFETTVDGDRVCGCVCFDVDDVSCGHSIQKR